jgi:hypothetical protein
MPNTDKKEEEEKKEDEVKFYREAFNNFDWNSSGTIPTKVSLITQSVIRRGVFV